MTLPYGCLPQLLKSDLCRGGLAAWQEGSINAGDLTFLFHSWTKLRRAVPTSSLKLGMSGEEAGSRESYQSSLSWGLTVRGELAETTKV